TELPCVARKPPRSCICQTAIRTYSSEWLLIPMTFTGDRARCVIVRFYRGRPRHEPILSDGLLAANTSRAAESLIAVVRWRNRRGAGDRTYQKQTVNGSS